MAAKINKAPFAVKSPSSKRQPGRPRKGIALAPAPATTPPAYETAESLRRELDAMRSQRDHWRRTAAEFGDEIGDVRARLGGVADEQLDGPGGLAAQVKAQADQAAPVRTDGNGGDRLRILRLERAVAFARADNLALAAAMQSQAHQLLGGLTGRLRELSAAFEGAGASAEESGISCLATVHEELEQIRNLDAEIEKLGGPKIEEDELCQGAGDFVGVEEDLAKVALTSDEAHRRATELLEKSRATLPIRNALKIAG